MHMKHEIKCISCTSITLPPAHSHGLDYQVVWRQWNMECPTSWRLFGSEGTTDPTELNGGGGMGWTLVHEVGTSLARTESETFKYLNFTVTNPGYYQGIAISINFTRQIHDFTITIQTRR